MFSRSGLSVKCEGTNMKVLLITEATVHTCAAEENHWKLTHWGRDKMDAISQTAFSRPFSSMKIVVFWLNFHWNMFARIQWTIIQHWFRLWLGADQATSHYRNQWWLIYRRIYASLGLNELTYLRQNQMAAILQIMFSNSFSLIKFP